MGACERQCNGPLGEVWYCVDCCLHFCERCWDQFPPHMGDRRGRDGMRHEKTKYRTFRKLGNILDPQLSGEALEQLHRDDLDSTWFGITKNMDGAPYFTDYNVYANLMSHVPDSNALRTPQLVSFIGQTNAGKSTLVKMLIDHDADEIYHSRSSFPSPVVGCGQHVGLATSADVHLYADPDTYFSHAPVLYADCEGLGAGEELPQAVASRRNQNIDEEQSLARLTPGRKRTLEWANTARTRTREFIVSELYPRILYTFSDVVVFVLRNANTFQSDVLRRLLDWGSTSLEKSVNQPTLPHAIIAVNATNVGIDGQEWEVGVATSSLLRSVRGSLDPVNGVPDFYRLAQSWRAKGRIIDSVLDLIRCYYSSFSVVRIPIQGRYTLLSNQISKLRRTISDRCNESFLTKRKARMLSSSDELSLYLQAAFDHFSGTLNRPFNFVQVSLRHNPIPDDFGGHILQLAICIQAHTKADRNSWIFQRLSPVLASSVLLDFVRHRKGLPEDLFAEYEDFFLYALEEYCWKYSICQYRGRKGDRCVSALSTHDWKGHQNDKGKVIHAGQFESDFYYDDYCYIWIGLLKGDLAEIHNQLRIQQESGPREVSEEQHLLKIHSRLMTELYDSIGSAGRVLSHSTCFCCLMQTPQHCLPCGHVLCTACVKSYGKLNDNNKDSRFVVKLDSCPMHPDETRMHWPSPCVIRFKPDYAGVRLLCLDGGGIRGIVELEILRTIQREFQDQIPIQAFFDLIVGTSTGGIISLAFGVMNWDLRECIIRFRSICDEAFSPRDWLGIPGIRQIAAWRHASKYRTKPFHSVLQSNFGRANLFGARRADSTGYGPKVAVTATDEAGRKAIVLANYRRIDRTKNRRRKTTHEFLRPDNPNLELKVWEAAAATSAAPTYFKPFEHKSSNRTYLDGALYNNNPVKIIQRERKLLWPEVAGKHPDILLSIGTGQNEDAIRRDLPERDSRSKHRRHRRDRPDESKSQGVGWSVFPNIRQIFRVMHNRFDNVLNAEVAWKEFYYDAIDDGFEDTDGLRYIRLNPNIGHDPPALDAKGEITNLQNDIRRTLRTPENVKLVQRIVHTLVASSFYFERTSVPRNEQEANYYCSGQICCRFEDGSNYVRALGEFLRLQQTHDFQPYFEIEEVAAQRQTTKIEITPRMVSRMRDHATFEVSIPNVRVSKKSAETIIYLHLMNSNSSPNKTPISGFPRYLMMEESVKIPTPMSPSELDGNDIDARKNKDRWYGVPAESKGNFNRRNQPIQDPRRNIPDPAQIQRDGGDSRRAQPQRHGIPSPITNPVTELPAESFGARISRPNIERRDTHPRGNIRRRQEEPRQEPLQGPITPAELAAPEPVSRSIPLDRVPSDELARKGPPRRTERQQPEPEGAKSQDQHESRHQQTPCEQDRSSRRRSQPTKSSQKETKRQLRRSKETVERSSGRQRSTDGNVPVEPFIGAPARGTLPIAPGSAPPRKYQQRQRRPLDPPSSIPGPSNRPSMCRDPVGASNPAPPGRHSVASPISSLHEDCSIDTCSEFTGDGSHFSKVSENTNDSYRRLAEEGERRRPRPSPSTLWKRLTKPGTREDM